MVRGTQRAVQSDISVKSCIIGGHGEREPDYAAHNQPNEKGGNDCDDIFCVTVGPIRARYAHPTLRCRVVRRVSRCRSCWRSVARLEVRATSWTVLDSRGDISATHWTIRHDVGPGPLLFHLIPR